MFKLAISVLALATLALASEQKGDYDEYNDAHPVPKAHHSGYYYPYYGYYPYHYNYYPAPYYYYPGYYGSYHPYVPYDHRYQPHAPTHYAGLVFIGKFEGTCNGAANGVYFVDDRSFAYCSNGIKTIQSCAEGSANPPYSKFEKGKYYQFNEFCSVNLVAHGQGYSAHQTTEVKQPEKTAHY